MKHKYITYLLIIFFLILFIGGNSIIVIGHTNSLNQISTTQTLNTKVSAYKNYSSEPEVAYINIVNEFNAEGKAIVLENLNFISYSINSISGKYSSNYLELNSEFIYLKSLSDFNLKFSNTLITLSKDSIVLIDTSNIYILEGSIRYDNNVVDVSYQVSEISSQLSVFKTNREIFKEDEYSEFILMLKNFELYSEYFSDFTSPELFSITPRNNFKTTEAYLNINGVTEKNIVVKLNDLETISLEDGSFDFRIDLTLGDNLIKLTLIDNYLNSTTENLKYVRSSVPLKPISNVVSYPNSYPLSYSN